MLLNGRDLTLGFGDIQVLSGLSFNIPLGRHTVFKGESGSGKSTLLKLLLGFLKPTSGQLLFENNGPSTLRKITAWLPQDLNMGTGTVEEVILKPFEFQANKSNTPDRSTILKTMGALGLTNEDLNKPFRNLSTGQRQRVGLAICSLLDKPVLMLDEPTSALDSASKQKAAELLLNKSDKTIISTSHDSFWINHADKIIELS